jgi:hypothetical protein
MINAKQFAPCVFRRSLVSIILISLFALPWFIRTTRADHLTTSNEPEASATTGKSNAPTASEFPYVLKFEQGAISFKDGDKITIHEVRGTAPTFAPGNIYWIRGTYTLDSHDNALLAANTTVKDAAHGTSDSYSVQHMNVDKGTGTFTLFLPMLYDGWPHVSFYAGGKSMGGIYFGTGDSVLKK